MLNYFSNILGNLSLKKKTTDDSSRTLKSLQCNHFMFSTSNVTVEKAWKKGSLWLVILIKWVGLIMYTRDAKVLTVVT